MSNDRASIVQVRPLRRRDVKAVQRIDKAAHGEAWSTDMIAAAVTDATRHHLVAVSGRTIVGHAAAWNDGMNFRITNLAVEGPHHGKGIGARLLAELISIALDLRSCDRLSLEVRAANEPAKALYRRFGLAPAGILRNFYPDAGAAGFGRDALVMRADLDDTGWQLRVSGLSPSVEDAVNRVRQSRNQTGTATNSLEGAKK